MLNRRPSKKSAARAATPLFIFRGTEGLSQDGLLAVDDIDALARILDSYTLEIVDDILAHRRSPDLLDASGASHMRLRTETALSVGRTDGQSVEVWVDVDIVRCLVRNRDECVVLE